MNLTDEELEKGLKVTEYFYDHFGSDKAKFIMSRIAVAVKGHTYSELISVGEKIALFNGWEAK